MPIGLCATAAAAAIAAAGEDAGGCFTVILQAALCELPKELLNESHDLFCIATIEVTHDIQGDIRWEIPAEMAAARGQQS
jgi:hypothetical protein